MAQAERRVSLGELIQHAGITPVTTREPCLPAPSQPKNLPSEEDCTQARDILIRRRQKNPESKDAILKRIFKSSKEKEKALDTTQWEFSQDELDQALSAVIRNPDSSPGLVQAFLSLGAKVNVVDGDKKKSKNNAPNSSLRRRSTVLQQAATLRKADAVNLLACSGADQTTLDEGLKAALTAKDQACVEELLRHGADLNRFPSSLAAVVQYGDQDFVRLLLRAPKALHPEIISSSLPVAVRQNSEPIASLLISYGADPNFDSASALNMAIGKEDWHMTLILVSGPTPLAPPNLQRLLDTVMRLRTCVATLRFLQLLFCCGLPPASIGLPDLLICRVRKNDTPGSKMMINHGVPTTANEAECLRLAVGNKNWTLVDAILGTPIEAQHASAALATLPLDTNPSDRLHVIQDLLQKGGPENLDIIQLLLAAKSKLLRPAFEYTLALEDVSKKKPLMEALLKHGIPQEALDNALTTETQYAATTKDLSTTTVLMRQGASVSGDALGIAVASGDDMLTRVLLSGKRQPSRFDTTKAFCAFFLERALRTINVESMLSIAEQLLHCGVEQSAIDAALRATLDIPNDPRSTDILTDLLLQRNADVNSADGVCFLLAAQKHSPSTFEKLLRRQPKFSLVISTLLSSKMSDQIVVNSINLCFKHGCTSDGLDLVPFGNRKTSVLIMAMQSHPRCEKILKLFLDHRWNPNITIRDVVDPASGEETISALLWALLQPQKRISDSILRELLAAGASVTHVSPTSDITPLAVAAREGRDDIVQALLERGANPSVRDKWNRSALFYASSNSAITLATVQTLAAKALKDDCSVHEATRRLRLDVVSSLMRHGHNPNFPSRLHDGRNALGELCLHAEVNTGHQRVELRHVIRLLLDNGVDPLFRARNEKSSIILALDNTNSALEVTDALLETEVWETLNDEKHIYQLNGLFYSPISYVEHILAPHHNSLKYQLVDLLCDKGCKSRFHSKTDEQPQGAVGIPQAIARLVDRRNEHLLAMKHSHEMQEHDRTLEETIHKDLLRRKREAQAADFATQEAAQAHWQKLEQQKHDFEVQRVQAAERMKRAEKVAWHNLMMEQERDAAATRQKAEERRSNAAAAHEARMMEQRKGETEHRAGVERRVLKVKEEMYERNVARQKGITKRLAESAQLHAQLKQERPAIEGSAQWGTVD
ncbi:hypothetical protein SLS59_005775 [Nothophoma quercina]|uniref:Uncharacterized protein n=1 Tax=Nothophoma quercina TaxID=749835 RepID=A0ABR3R9J0_9PLEO